KVWTPAVGTKVTVKLEGTGATEVLVTTTKANEWEELTFDFASSEDGKYDKIVLFFNIETNTPGEFYIDDFMLYERSGGGAACTPETAQSLDVADFNLTFQTDPTASITDDGAVMISVANPDSDNTVNSSCQVGKVTRNPDFQYANNQINFDTPLDFNANAGFKIKVWTPAVGTTVTVKLEGTGATEVQATTTKANEWEELTFNFASSESGKYTKIVLFFNINSNTPGEFYIDDFMLYGTGGGTACTDTTLVLPIDFDCEGIDYASKIVGNVSFSIIDNPELSGINNVASKVGSIVNVGANWENALFNLDTPIDFSANNTIKFKFYSTVSVDLKLKMEDGTADPVEVDVNHGGTGWEELSFTFTNTDSYNDMIIFVDGPGTTAGTFYVDDIEQVAGGGGNGGGDCPAPPAGELLPNGDFEAIGDCWELIQNGGTVTVSSTISNGGIKSGEISTAPLQNPALKQTRFAVGLIQPNTSYTVSFDIKASIALVDGAVLKAFTFSEGADGGGVGATQHILEGGLGSVSASWETKTYTFTTPAGADQVAGGLSFLVEVVCGGANTCAGTVNVDNVVVKVTP
ncbi:MAG: hypothetical protein MUP24_10860, partial [Gillisia sp.]|nr:hypothetical protein [Gillisia sp.]